jgi:hypothetical protein
MSPAAYPTDWNAMSLPALFDALCRADAEDAVTRALREDLGVALAVIDVDGVVARLGRHVLDDVLVVEEGRREQVRLARVLVRRRKAEGERAGSLAEARVMLTRAAERRGLLLTADQRGRIAECHELETLERWFDGVVVATHADGLIA